MPLDELSSNIQRTSSTRQNNANKHTEPAPARSSQPRPPPLSIQVMLKSSTELGDVGVFAQRPPRVPRSATQTSLGAHSRTSASSSLHPRRHHRQYLDPATTFSNRPVTSSSQDFRRSGSIRSTASAFPDPSRSRRTRLRHLPAPYQHQASVRSRNLQHNLQSRRSLASLRSHATSTGMLSPYGRPYLARGASPALSNVYDYRYRTAARHSSLRTDLSSSGSLFSMGPEDYRVEHSASAVSFRPLPSPAAHSRRYRRANQNSLARTLTPASIVGAEHPLGSGASFASEPVSPTDSVVPFYYDYSESFHGREALLSPSIGHTPINGKDNPDAENQCSAYRSILPSQNPFDVVFGSTISPAELPTRHNRRASEQSLRHSRKLSSRSSKSTHVPSHQAIEEEAQEDDDEDLPEVVQPHTDHPSSASDYEVKLTECHQPNGPRNWPSPSSSTFFTNASRSPRNLTELAARAHSPEASLGHIASIDAIAQQGECPVQTLDKEQDAVRQASEDYQLPTLKFRPLSITVTAEPRPLTSPVATTRPAPEIISPRPERPTSSQSRKRFSKILDVDQNQSIFDLYDSHATATGPALPRLERVDEASSPLKTPLEHGPQPVSTSRRYGKAMSHSAGPPSSRGRWSGVTSHDQSTVESLLEKHIECLGLRPQGGIASDASVYCESKNELEQIPETDAADPSSVATSYDKSFQELSDSHRPTSLTTSAQRRLMPRKLFASLTDTKSPKFPFASSESDTGFSLAWTDEQARPSYGWLPLPSESHIGLGCQKSTQSLLSGEFADVESGRTGKRFRLRRYSSPTLSAGSNAKEESVQTNVIDGIEAESTPRQRSHHKGVLRNDSQRHRRLKIHLKTRQPALEPSTSDEWMSTDEKLSQTDLELHRLGLTRVPISAVDGFAELSGESESASQQSLNTITNSELPRSPGTWSNIVAAMPLPTRKPTGMRKKDSFKTIQSHESKHSIVEPVNTSRVSSRKQSQEIKPQTGVPQLAHPDLGPTMRASQFDLSAGCQLKPHSHKVSIFSKPKDLLAATPPKQDQQGVRNHGRLKGIRQIMPPSIRSFTFSPPSIQNNQHFNLSHGCRAERPASCSDRPSYSETVAMSDFAYRKHRILEKLREWCRRRCGQRPFASRRRKNVPSGGFIV